jgi:hypothetical protein
MHEGEPVRHRRDFDRLLGVNRATAVLEAAGNSPRAVEARAAALNPAMIVTEPRRSTVGIVATTRRALNDWRRQVSTGWRQAI